MIRNYLVRSGLALAAPAMMLGAGGAVQAHSDIFFSYENDKIVIEWDSHLGNIFEGDFKDLAQGPYGTDDPGFNTLSAITPGDILGFKVAGPLVYHDGSDFLATDAVLSIEDVTGPWVRVDGTTSADDSLSGYIGQANGSGGFHAHVDFYAFNAGDSFYDGLSVPAEGAYGIQLELFTVNSAFGDNGIANSDPFWIVFNNGLASGTFHSVLHAFEHYGHDHGHGDDDDDDDHGHGHVVPTPSAAMLAGIGGIGMLLRRGRRSDA